MSFLQELKRRNVTKVAALYVVASWLILQAAELLFDAMSVPQEWLRFLIAILVLGFPLILIFSWVFEITPDGVKREKDIDRDASITPQNRARRKTPSLYCRLWICRPMEIRNISRMVLPKKF